MGEGIEIKLDKQFDEWLPELQRLGSVMRGIKQPLRQMGSRLVNSTKHRFELSTGPVNTLGRGAGPAWRDAAWPPLADATIKGRRTGKGRKRSGVKPLIDTGTLMRSIHYQVSADGDELHVGTNHQVGTAASAAIHQLGGMAGRGHQTKIPARPFLGIDSGDLHEMQGIVSAYLGRAA